MAKKNRYSLHATHNGALNWLDKGLYFESCHRANTKAWLAEVEWLEKLNGARYRYYKNLEYDRVGSIKGKEWQ